MNIISIPDPTSLNDAARNTNPYLRDGVLDIHFESFENMHAYIDIHVERPGLNLKHSPDKPTGDAGTDWNLPRRRQACRQTSPTVLTQIPRLRQH
ncbi:MAG: hypothetical protein QNJ82_00010 [Gammaproteobacteria bacterium]|nr:hypothetical protein [Gammaproteobacteria bacterium]